MAITWKEHDWSMEGLAGSGWIWKKGVPVSKGYSCGSKVSFFRTISSTEAKRQILVSWEWSFLCATSSVLFQIFHGGMMVDPS